MPPSHRFLMAGLIRIRRRTGVALLSKHCRNIAAVKRAVIHEMLNKVHAARLEIAGPAKSFQFVVPLEKDPNRSA